MSVTANKKNKSDKKNQSITIENRKAWHDFHIEDSMICGITLTSYPITSGIIKVIAVVRLLRRNKVAPRNDKGHVKI